jgi:hypothetical protein
LPENIIDSERACQNKHNWRQKITDFHSAVENFIWFRKNSGNTIITINFKSPNAKSPDRLYKRSGLFEE